MCLYVGVSVFLKFLPKFCAKEFYFAFPVQLTPSHLVGTIFGTSFSGAVCVCGHFAKIGK